MPEESSIAGDGRKKKNVKMGRCNLKYNVLAEEVCHALHDVHLVARMSGHS